MTQLCLPKNNNKSSEFSMLCSYIMSHPLYFSYLIFFSPYLFKLLSFLSPLFLTTFLLFLSLVTTLIPLHSIMNSKDSFFLAAYTTLIENFKPSFDNDDDNDEKLEEFEVYKVVFDVPIIELTEANPDEDIEFGENPVEEMCQFDEKIVDRVECLTLVHETGDTNCEKLGGEKEMIQEVIVENVGSEVKKTVKLSSLKVKNGEKLSEAFHQTVGVQQNLAGFGSMRKEKEWRRTLACKLFEERHNWSNNSRINSVNEENGEEGMDLLWETNETIEINQGKLKEIENYGNNCNKEGRTKVDNNKNNKIEDLMKIEKGEESEESEEYDEIGKICCLQALKLSAGKMNLSMGKPNLLKFSKAFKGIGWLHNHVKKKGNKGYK
ncbi:uncharacterized protein LOC141590941 [Silene latifolia]|uniref:uncharacterized protein LOC141590941 n=1 Tax=Silene latifolia TaxID=37657 RepID=UPI003D7764BA